MDNITHTLVGVLLGQMGLKRQSRFAMAACVLGANAPDIDVFAPLLLPVDGIQFHRGPIHSVFAWPVLAAAIVAILWLVDRLRRAPPDAVPFRGWPLFGVALIAIGSHLFLDWLTTYAIALLAPASWRWSSGNAIFIIDWVYWILMIAGISWSASRWRRGAENPGRPAQIAGVIMLGYIAFNLGESARLEQATAERLRVRGIEPALVVASPPPLAFWNRRLLWRSADRWGSGAYDMNQGLTLDPASHPTNLDDPRLAAAARRDQHVRAFLVWSRMPVVVSEDGKAYLTDQRFFGRTIRIGRRSSNAREAYRFDPFLIPLDNPEPSS
jgi:inner membrane protein